MASVYQQLVIYNAHRGTYELARALLVTLRDHHPRPWMITMSAHFESEQDHILYIVVCPASICGGNHRIAMPKHYIVYQLEPTYRMESEQYRDVLRRALMVWDYQACNIPYLTKLGITAIHVPVGYHPSISSPIVRAGSFPLEVQNTDILFLGVYHQPRRRIIYQQLLQKGLSVRFAHNLNIDEMQAAIRQAKICLNLHQQDQDSGCLETVRLNILLANQAAVVSEQLVDLSPPYQHPEIPGVIFCAHEQIVATCEALLADDNRRRQLAWTGYQQYSQHPWDQLVNFDQLLANFTLSTDEHAAAVQKQSSPRSTTSRFREIQIWNGFWATAEVARAMLTAIREVHPRPWLVTITQEYLLNSDDILYIIICPGGNGRTERPAPHPKHYIAYQLEPTVVLERKVYQNLLRRAYAVWDYVAVNCDYLASIGIPATFVPIGYQPLISSPELLLGSQSYLDNERDIDVLFLGYDVYPRRAAVRNQLTCYGLNVVFICNQDLRGMQNFIKRSKICLSIRGRDDNVTSIETIRLNVLLSNVAVIVCEDLGGSVDSVMQTYSKAVHFSKYDNIVKDCLALLADFPRRQRYAHHSYQWYINRPWHRLVDFNSLLPQLV